ncbi:unnamed protein product [Amaranthus hypochondriacus]
MADWSELPLDLLQLISNLINTSSNTRHFRSVCSSWRSSVPPNPSTHFHPHTIKFFSSHLHHLDLRLAKQTIFLISHSSDPNSSWVIKTEEKKPGVFHLLSPFSNKNLIKNSNSNVLEISNVNILEIGHEYVLHSIGGNGDGDLNLYNMENEKVTFVGENGNFTILSTHNISGKLLMYKSNLQEWAFLEDGALGYDDRSEFVYDWSFRYVDVAEYDGKFYAVTDYGRTVIIDYVDDYSVAVTLMVKSITGGDKKYLVKSGNELLLVDLYTCSVDGLLEVNAIDVYKLENDEKKWTLLTSLGGRTIFLSKHFTFSTSNVMGLKRNCIYFSPKNLGREFFYEKKDGNVDDDWDEDVVKSSDEIGVFDYEKGDFGSLEDSKCFCWPPPSWVNILNQEMF